jgi:hypothetical protein
MYVKWDHTNLAVDAIMIKEASPNTTMELRNYKWIEELKNKIGWEIGYIIRFNLIHLCKGEIVIHWVDTMKNTHSIVDEDGYFYTRSYDDPLLQFVKVNCIHNMNVYDNEDPYILK